MAEGGFSSRGINPMFALMANLPIQTCTASSTANSPPMTQLPYEYPEALGGIYSDNIIDPADVMGIFNVLVVDGRKGVHTPLSVAFLSEANVEHMRRAVEQNIREYTGEDNIIYLLQREFAQTLIDLLLDNLALSFDVKASVPLLNDIAVHHETQIALLSQRHTKRYTRWALHNDRMKVMPHGIGDKTLHVHGENQVNPSGYELNHPFKSQYGQFLKDVLHIQCPSNSTRPCQMPPFPQRFATP